MCMFLLFGSDPRLFSGPGFQYSEYFYSRDRRNSCEKGSRIEVQTGTYVKTYLVSFIYQTSISRDKFISHRRESGCYFRYFTLDREVVEWSEKRRCNGDDERDIGRRQEILRECNPNKEVRYTDTSMDLVGRKGRGPIKVSVRNLESYFLYGNFFRRDYTGV